MSRKQPVATFGPELLATLLAGATRTLRISMTYREAVRFRLRMYQLRKAMRDEHHPQAENVQRVFARILWGPLIGNEPVKEVVSSKGVKRPSDIETPSIVVVGPQDSDFNDALKKAGIEISVGNSDDLLPS